jgi:hypothetical protein
MAFPTYVKVVVDEAFAAIVLGYDMMLCEGFLIVASGTKAGFYSFEFAVIPIHAFKLRQAERLFEGYIWVVCYIFE